MKRQGAWVLGGLILLMMAAGLLPAGCGSSQVPVKDEVVRRVVGRYLQFGSGHVVALVGVYIPLPGEKNFSADSFRHVREMLVDQTVQVRVVEQKRDDGGYPEVDLAEVSYNGVDINRDLLDRGVAFFNEDHWDRKEKEEFEALTAEARKAGRGIWADRDSLEVLFVRPVNGRFIHFPNCPHVRDLKESERVNYYVPIPQTPLMGTRFAYFCDYCRPLFDEKQAEMDEHKFRLET